MMCAAGKQTVFKHAQSERVAQHLPLRAQDYHGACEVEFPAELAAGLCVESQSMRAR